MSESSLDARNKVGLIGEHVFQIELLKRGLVCEKLSKWFDFDLVTNYGDRIEVKSAFPTYSTRKYPDKIYRYKRWQFRNYSHKQDRGAGRTRNCDFYAFVCFEKEFHVVAIYIVPVADIKSRNMIYVYNKPNSMFNEFQNDFTGLKGAKRIENICT